MAGQAHHFLKYAPAMEPPNDLPYAKERYRKEVARLYGVLDRRLADNTFVAGEFYSIADIAIWPWASLWEGQQQDISKLPHMERWLARCFERSGVKAGRALKAELRSDFRSDKTAQNLLFQRNS